MSAAEGRPCVAVAHKGIIRALYALATGWDLSRDPPDKLVWGSAQVFRLTPDGGLSVMRLNLSLQP